MVKLINKLETARSVLQITELARKMETEIEKVQPFKVESSSSQQQQQLSAKQVSNNEESKIADYNEEAEESLDEDDEAALGSSLQGKANANINVLQSSVYNQDGEFIPPSDRLSKFYIKYNKIVLDCVAIDKEKERLGKENAQLEDLIQQYLDGLQLSDSTLAEDNPLFVVNGRYLIKAFIINNFLNFK
jgi:hypothetical protein